MGCEDLPSSLHRRQKRLSSSRPIQPRCSRRTCSSAVSRSRRFLFCEQAKGWSPEHLAANQQWLRAFQSVMLAQTGEKRRTKFKRTITRGALRRLLK
jgi:hypothetical protein